MKTMILRLAILSLLVSSTAQAQVSFAPYDDFNTTLIDPQKWYGYEVIIGGGINLPESIREIDRGALHLSDRVYNLSSSGTSYSWGGNRIGIVNGKSVIGIKATAQVAAVEAEKTVCTSGNNLPTIARARVAGNFFNHAGGEEGKDVLAFISIQRQSDSADRSSILDIVGYVYQCYTTNCTSPDLLGEVNLGQTIIGRKVNLSIQWDQNVKRFIFQLDRNQPVFIYYSVNDDSPPYSDVKVLDLTHRVPNCGNGTAESPAMASMDVYFDNIYVQRSTNP
jgi:hypothetical protein